MMKSSDKPFLPYGRQTIEADDIAAVTDVLQSDFLTTGPKVGEFEALLAEKTGAQHAVVVGNGTHALHLAGLAAGFAEGNYAIVPSITFLATANAVRYCGANVIFSDVDPDTGLMRPQDLQRALDENKDKNIKGVLPVHIGGQSVDLLALKEIADKHGIKIIADSCHALGGTYNGGHRVGSCAIEDMATFSFHPVKNIAMGEGGAITTNDSEIANKMRIQRTHGMHQKPEAGLWVYEMPELGFNYRATDMQCALGISQLHKLERFITKRQELVDMYDGLLGALAPVVLPPQRVENTNAAWHLYAPRFDFAAMGISRNDFMHALRAQNIGSQVHYIPVHTQPYYEGLYGVQNLEGAAHYYEHTLSLPLFPLMEKADVVRVVDTIKEIIA